LLTSSKEFFFCSHRMPACGTRQSPPKFVGNEEASMTCSNSSVFVSFLSSLTLSRVTGSSSSDTSDLFFCFVFVCGGKGCSENSLVNGLVRVMWLDGGIGHTLQHTATNCNTLQHTLIDVTWWWPGNMTHTATHCNTLLHTATHCNTISLMWLDSGIWHTLQHTATHYNTRLHTATHGNTLQHTLIDVTWWWNMTHIATHCNTL